MTERIKTFSWALYFSTEQELNIVCVITARLLCGKDTKNKPAEMSIIAVTWSLGTGEIGHRSSWLQEILSQVITIEPEQWHFSHWHLFCQIPNSSHWSPLNRAGGAIHPLMSQRSTSGCCFLELQLFRPVGKTPVGKTPVFPLRKQELNSLVKQGESRRNLIAQGGCSILQLWAGPCPFWLLFPPLSSSASREGKGSRPETAVFILIQLWEKLYCSKGWMKVGNWARRMSRH